MADGHWITLRHERGSPMTTDEAGVKCEAEESLLEQAMKRTNESPTETENVSPDEGTNKVLKVDAEVVEGTSKDASAEEKGDITTQDEPKEGPIIKFTITYLKEKKDMSLPSTELVINLKKIMEEEFKVPISGQKLMYKGMGKDQDTLGKWGLKDGARVILIGSRAEEIAAVQTKPSTSEVKEDKKVKQKTELLQVVKQHKKILDMGKPEDAMVAIKNVNDYVPTTGIKGMYNKFGKKVRLSFVLEKDELRISTNERTETVKMTRITSVIDEAISGHDGYYILGLSIGATDKSILWFYWVPAQYVNNIKKTIMGD